MAFGAVLDDRDILILLAAGRGVLAAKRENFNHDRKNVQTGFYNDDSRRKGKYDGYI